MQNKKTIYNMVLPLVEMQLEETMIRQEELLVALHPLNLCFFLRTHAPWSFQLSAMKIQNIHFRYTVYQKDNQITIPCTMIKKIKHTTQKKQVYALIIIFPMQQRQKLQTSIKRKNVWI